MLPISFHGSKGGVAATMIILVFAVCVTFTTIRMNVSGKVSRYKKECAIYKVQLENENQKEIEGY